MGKSFQYNRTTDTIRVMEDQQIEGSKDKVPVTKDSVINRFKQGLGRLNNRWWLIGLIATLLVIGFASALILPGVISKQQLISAERSRRAEADKSAAEYAELLKQQAEKKSSPRPIEVTDITAKGSQKVLFVLVKPDGLDMATISPLVNILESGNKDIYTPCANCTKAASLDFVASFIQKEAARYKQQNFSLDVQVRGVYSIKSIVKVGDIAYVWGKDLFDIVKLRDLFENVLKSEKIMPEENTRVVFLFFDNSFGGGQDSRRFYENKAFRSFAEPDLKRAYVNVYNFEPAFSLTLVEIVTHELMHLYGASDKYAEDSQDLRICSKDGWGEIGQVPSTPQKSADIMCGYIELENEKFKRAGLLNETVTINEVTARQIGWSN